MNAEQVMELCKASYRQGGIDAIDSLADGWEAAKRNGIDLSLEAAIAQIRALIDRTP